MSCKWYLAIIIGCNDHCGALGESKHMLQEASIILYNTYSRLWANHQFFKLVSSSGIQFILNRVLGAYWTWVVFLNIKVWIHSCPLIILYSCAHNTAVCLSQSHSWWALSHCWQNCEIWRAYLFQHGLRWVGVTIRHLLGHLCLYNFSVYCACFLPKALHGASTSWLASYPLFTILGLCQIGMMVPCVRPVSFIHMIFLLMAFMFSLGNI